MVFDLVNERCVFMWGRRRKIRSLARFHVSCAQINDHPGPGARDSINPQQQILPLRPYFFGRYMLKTFRDVARG
jgi:hypothetical protein